MAVNSYCTWGACVTYSKWCWDWGGHGNECDLRCWCRSWGCGHNGLRSWCCCHVWDDDWLRLHDDLRSGDILGGCSNHLQQHMEQHSIAVEPALQFCFVALAVLCLRDPNRWVLS